MKIRSGEIEDVKFAMSVCAVNEMKSKLRRLRLIQIAMIAVIPIFGWVAEFGRDPGSNDWTWRHWLVTGLALWRALGGFRLRPRLLHRSEQLLTNDASNPKALKQWEAANFIGLASAESVVLWGSVVRMVLGGALWQGLLFYAAGLVLLLLWTPRMPITASAAI
jgi:F0F1-type ATP synthase membrane subunit c/vacuolar-type H+-ATPase subunit K